MEIKNRPVKMKRKQIDAHLEVIVGDILVESSKGDWDSLNKLKSSIDYYSQTGYYNSKHYERIYALLVEEKEDKL